MRLLSRLEQRARLTSECPIHGSYPVAESILLWAWQWYENTPVGEHSKPLCSPSQWVKVCQWPSRFLTTLQCKVGALSREARVSWLACPTVGPLSVLQCPGCAGHSDIPPRLNKAKGCRRDQVEPWFSESYQNSRRHLVMGEYAPWSYSSPWISRGSWTLKSPDCDFYFLDSDDLSSHLGSKS